MNFENQLGINNECKCYIKCFMSAALGHHYYKQFVCYFVGNTSNCSYFPAFKWAKKESLTIPHPTFLFLRSCFINICNLNFMHLCFTPEKGFTKIAIGQNCENCKIAKNCNRGKVSRQSVLVNAFYFVLNDLFSAFLVQGFGNFSARFWKFEKFPK